MNELICKSCGGTLEFEEGQSVAVCDSCGKKQTLPRFRSDKKKNLFARASQLCRANKFDKALNCYEDALQEDAEDPEVHWMLAMCRYGVEYVEEADGKRKPTIHRIQQHSILADEDYKEALKYADDDQKSVYEAEAREIDRIHKAFMDIARNEKPFDVFICYKETDENGKRTQDSTLANELYHSLSQDGFKVFFAAITLEDKLGTDYEPYIFAALQSAKVMVVMGTKKEYFEATWVRNEWNRYLSLIESEKEQNHISKRALIPAYKDMDAYDLPEEFAHLQAMDMSKLGFMPDLIRGIRKILEAAKEKPAAQAAQPVAMDPGKPNLKNLETRMFNFCQDGDWKKAEEYAERILDNDPNNGKAYLGHLLVESGCKNVNELRNSTILLPNYRYFTNAMEKGDEQQQAMLREMTQFVTKRMEDERREAIYADGMRNLMKAKHTQDEQAAVNAMHILRKVKGWRDANERAQESEELANAIREEKQRIADERAAKAKRQKRNKLITKLVLAACGIFFIWFMVNGRRDLALSKAKKMIRNEQYEEAYEILGKLGEYKGASALIVTNICERANAQIDAGNLDAARDLLMPYPESSEAQEVMRRVDYEYGKAALAKKDYDRAYSYLSASGSYEDADTLIADSKYTRAGESFASQDYETVIDLLNGLEVYKEAPAMLQESHYKLAINALSEEDYGSALIHFHRAGDYEDSLAQRDELLEGTLALGIYFPAYRVLLETDPERAEELMSEQPWLGIMNASVNSTVELGSYEQDNDKDNGAEPIEWMVMDYRDGKYLLVSRYNLDSKAFDAEKDAEGLTWENSDIREWLNGEFMDAAFTDAMKRQIAETVNSNPDMTIDATVEELSVPGGLEYINDYQGYENGEDTTDRVFLLSYPEYVRYGLADGQPEDTDYARDVVNKAGGDSSCVWTRTIANQNSPIFQIGDGRIYWGYGMGLTDAWHSFNTKGIRPALWFSIEN